MHCCLQKQYLFYQTSHDFTKLGSCGNECSVLCATLYLRAARIYGQQKEDRPKLHFFHHKALAHQFLLRTTVFRSEMEPRSDIKALTDFHQ